MEFYFLIAFETALIGFIVALAFLRRALRALRYIRKQVEQAPVETAYLVRIAAAATRWRRAEW